MTQADYIYLDYNATTPLCDAAKQAMLSVLGRPLNPSSVHRLGREAKQLLESARDAVRLALGAEGAEIIFTATGTEANNLAILGFSQADGVAVSQVEHVSILAPAKSKKAVLLPVDEHGCVDFVALERVLRAYAGKRLLVSVMLANNETGVIQNIAAIRGLVLAHKGFLHVDASQAIGKMAVDFNQLGVDMMTISGHKFGAPQGAAALIVKSGLVLEALLSGGGQEKFRRAGSENLAAIVGFGAALNSLPNFMGIALANREKLEYNLRSACVDVQIAGENVDRLANTSCITMPDVSAQTQLMHFDLDGFGVSSGSACSSGKVGQSHVLAAMGWSRSQADCAIRISTGVDTSEADIEKFIASWQRLYNRQQQKKVA